MRKSSNIHVFFSIHRPSAEPPASGGSGSTNSQVEKGESGEFKLSESKMTPFNLPRPVGVLREVSAQLGIWRESFDVDKSALNSLV